MSNEILGLFALLVLFAVIFVGFPSAITLGAILLIWFFGSLRSTLRGAEGGSGRVSAIAFGGGLLASAGLLMSAAPILQGAISEDDLVPESAQTLTLLSATLPVLVTW
jgi:hypothetical protein